MSSANIGGTRGRGRGRRVPGASRENMDKVREKLDKYFADGMYYEALQLYLTLYNRNAGAGEYAEAMKVMEEGADKMLEHKQGNAAGDLALKYVECLVASKTTPDDEHIETIVGLFTRFPPDSLDAQTKFGRAALDWTSKSGADSNGDPRIHYVLAVRLSEAADWGSAQKHWLRANKVQEHAQAMIEWSRRGFDSEKDLFIARAVLQYMATENLNAANILFDAYVNAYNNQLDTPLIHFTRFLLQTLERDALPLFEMLRTKYADSIKRDPSFNSYLDKIGEVYFGVKAPPSMLDELLSFAGAR